MKDESYRPRPFPVGTPCQVVELAAIEKVEDRDVIGGVVTIRYTLPLEEARAWGACFGLCGVVEPHPDTARLERAMKIAGRITADRVAMLEATRHYDERPLTADEAAASRAAYEALLKDCDALAALVGEGK